MILKNKFNASLFFLALSSVSFHLQARDPFGGWTGGVGVGATTFQSKNSYNAFVGNESYGANNHDYRYNAMASVFLGKNWVSPEMYLVGLELGVNFLGADEINYSANNQTSVTTIATTLEGASGRSTYNNSLNSDYTLSRNSVEPYLDLKLGLLFSPESLFFIRAGIEYNELEFEASGLYSAAGRNIITRGDGNSNSIGIFSGFDVKKERDKIGLRAGAGLEYLISPAWSLGANYIFTFYPHIHLNNVTNANDVACDVLEGCVIESTQFVSNASAKPYDQQAMLQLIYHLRNR